MFQTLPEVMAIAIPIVTVIAVFTFAGFAAFSDNRRKEREAFYRYEFRKKLIEQGTGASERVLELMREEDRAEQRQAREGVKLGGLITAAVGLGLIFGLRFIKGEDVWMVGYIPLAIGIVMLLYGLFLAPREPAPGQGGATPPAA
jgi:Flp pilus assembly protein TadB